MTQHSENSSYREKLVEHLFVGELLKRSWLKDKCALEIASPEVDNAGYDLIAEAHGVLRHIQLKASLIGARASRQKIHTRLVDKPSGCVVWICFNENTLELGPFLYFGGRAGEKLPDISDCKVAKHTKGNKDGVKSERPNIRVLPKGRFVTFDSIDALYAHLFHVSQQESS